MKSAMGQAAALAILFVSPGMAVAKVRGGMTAPVGLANRAATIGPRQGGFVNATEIYPWSDGAIFRLYTAPGRVSDIVLEPGETLVSVAAGDTVRWIVGNTTSGTGPNQREHVLVKPTAAGLSTNLLILTSRRSYHIDLVSTVGSAMASVSWSYPADSLISLTPPPAAKSPAEDSTAGGDFDPSRLDFAYLIGGDDMPWRPARAFDDGRHVYIDFPASIFAGAAPPLFVIDGKKPELVNYRMRGHFYVVDRLFDRAELRLGDKPQHVVTISRTSRGATP